MWIFVIVVVVAIFLFKFATSLNEDAAELNEKPLSEKFETLVFALNDAAFAGNGEITVIDKRNFNLYPPNGSNQIIQFSYGTGQLTVTWCYKYLQKELTHIKQFPNVRNISLLDQQRMADALISEMMLKVEHHKVDVWGLNK